MLKAGDYVRVFNPLKTIVGTIEGAKSENGFVQYLFHSDPRIAGIGDFWVSEDEVERCEKDSQIRRNLDTK